MAVTTTPSISSLIKRLSPLVPAIAFEPDDDFAWSPAAHTVTYTEAAPDASWQLLHEVGHATCRHEGYRRDIELLGYEVEAWEAAKQLAAKLDLRIPHEIIEEHLDTYRDWLHARSQCVDCAQTGIQTHTDTYRCLHCPASWRVNDGRHCGLRRYRTA